MHTNTAYTMYVQQQYGAYRRWKLAETEDGKPRLDSQGRPLKLKGTKSGQKPKGAWMSA